MTATPKHTRVELLKEAKKYKVVTGRQVHAYIDQCEKSAKAWANRIQDFLRENKLEDAEMRLDYDFYDQSLSSINIVGWVEKSDEELAQEIANAKEYEREKREEARERKKQASVLERETYERLKKKYG